ncbi:MAG: hypothetical protein NTU97_04090 [Candidatus Magasanikbacteria bacterium]|nr:hypothetical protein [Candidatus Magasanikbacteria bacterium]
MVYYSKMHRVTTIDLFFERADKYKIWLLIACVVFGMAYFWQVNSVSNRGFKIRDLEKQISLLKNSNQQLELQAASLQSLENLNDKIKQLNMVVPEKVEYLRPVGSGVALR